MHTEQVNSNQQTYQPTKSKSIFKRIKFFFNNTNKTTKPTTNTEKSFDTLAQSTASNAIAGIEISKKKYESPKITIKEVSDMPRQSLDNIIPDAPSLSEKEYKNLKKEIYSNKKAVNMFALPEDRYDEFVGPERAQIIKKIVDNDELMENRNIRKYSRKLVYSSPYFLNPKQAKVINVILDDKEKYNNEEVIKDAINVVPLIDKSNVNFVLKLLTDKKLRNAGFDLGASVIISNRIADDPEEASKCRDSFIDKFLDTKLLNENDNVRSNMGHTTFLLKNKKDLAYRTNILDKYLESTELQSQPHIKDSIGSIAMFTDNQYKANIVNRYLNTPTLYKNKDLKICNVLHSIKSPEKEAITNKMLDIYLSNKSLYKNDSLNKSLTTVLSETNEKNIDSRKFVMNKYKNSEELQNSKFSENLGNTLMFTDDKSLNVIDKIMENEKLYNNSNVVDNLPHILQKSKKTEDMEIINKILDKDEFINDKNTMNSIPNLMRDLNWNTDDAHDNRCNVLNKVLDDENLYKNKPLMSNLPEILSEVYYPEQADVVSTVLDNEKLLNNDKVLKNLPHWLSSTDGLGSVDEEKLEQVNETLNKISNDSDTDY